MKTIPKYAPAHDKTPKRQIIVFVDSTKSAKFSRKNNRADITDKIILNKITYELIVLKKIFFAFGVVKFAQMPNKLKEFSLLSRTFMIVCNLFASFLFPLRCDDDFFRGFKSKTARIVMCEPNIVLY